MTSPITGATTRYVGGQPVGVDYTYDPNTPGFSASASLLVSGEEVFPRAEVLTANAYQPASGQIRPSYFTARKTEVTTQARVYTGTTAAAATPTLCRIGLWLADASGNLLSLVASTANDTTLFAATSTAYTKAWSAPYTKIAGQRYAFGVLVVSAGVMPSFASASGPYGVITLAPPAMTAVYVGQSDLPNSLSSPGANGVGRLYGEVL